MCLFLTPANDATIRGQGDHGVAPNGQIPFGRVPVVGQQGIGQPKQLHHPFVLPEVFVPLEQKRVFVAFAAFDQNFTRPLFRSDDGDGGHKRSDPHFAA